MLKNAFRRNFMTTFYWSINPTLVMIGDGLVQKGLHAGNIIRQAASIFRVVGGGQPHFATAGGKNAEGCNWQWRKF